MLRHQAAVRLERPGAGLGFRLNAAPLLRHAHGSAQQPPGGSILEKLCHRTLGDSTAFCVRLCYEPCKQGIASSRLGSGHSLSIGHASLLGLTRPALPAFVFHFQLQSGPWAQGGMHACVCRKRTQTCCEAVVGRAVCCPTAAAMRLVAYMQ